MTEKEEIEEKPVTFEYRKPKGIHENLSNIIETGNIKNLFSTKIPEKLFDKNYNFALEELFLDKAYEKLKNPKSVLKKIGNNKTDDYRIFEDTTTGEQITIMKEELNLHEDDINSSPLVRAGSLDSDYIKKLRKNPKKTNHWTPYPINMSKK